MALPGRPGARLVGGGCLWLGCTGGGEGEWTKGGGLYARFANGLMATEVGVSTRLSCDPVLREVVVVRLDTYALSRLDPRTLYQMTTPTTTPPTRRSARSTPTTAPAMAPALPLPPLPDGSSTISSHLSPSLSATQEHKFRLLHVWGGGREEKR